MGLNEGDSLVDIRTGVIYMGDGFIYYEGTGL